MRIELFQKKSKKRIWHNFLEKFGMRMDNPVTRLTIKYIQPNYCNFDF